MGFKRKKERAKLEPILKALLDDDHVFDKPQNRFEELSNEAYNKYATAPYREKLRLRYEFRKKLIRAIYVYTDPKEIPGEDLKIIAEYTSDDYRELKYFLRAHSPVTSIRAYCMNCQSHSIASVRNCTNGICPLYPFRMGSNPFYGKIADADQEVSEDFNENEGLENGEDSAADISETGSSDSAGAGAADTGRGSESADTGRSTRKAPKRIHRREQRNVSAS